MPSAQWQGAFFLDPASSPFALLRRARDCSRAASRGPAGRQEAVGTCARATAWNDFPNLVAMFLDRVQQRGDTPFLWAKRDGAWQSISYTEAARQVAALSESLIRLGCKPGDRVMLVSENRPEWLIADLAIMAAGCVTVPTYTTNTTRDHTHILTNSGARAVIVSSQKLAKALIPAVLFSSDCHDVIGIEDIRTGQAVNGAKFHVWADLVAQGGSLEAVRERMAGVERERPCLHHLHQRHRRRPARRSPAPWRDPPQHRRLHRRHRQRLRLGRRGVSVLPPRQPRLRAFGRADVPDRSGRANLLRRKPRKARRQYRGSAPDPDGGRPPPVRDAAPADAQDHRETGRVRRQAAEPRARDRQGALRQGVDSGEGLARPTLPSGCC